MITAMSIKYETIKSETIHTENADLTTTFTAERDPFDEPLEDNLIMNDTLFAEARNSVYSGSVVKTNFYAIYNESGECMFFS